MTNDDLLSSTLRMHTATDVRSRQQDSQDQHNIYKRQRAASPAANARLVLARRRLGHDRTLGASAEPQRGIRSRRPSRSCSRPTRTGRPVSALQTCAVRRSAELVADHHGKLRRHLRVRRSSKSSIGQHRSAHTRKQTWRVSDIPQSLAAPHARASRSAGQCQP